MGTKVLPAKGLKKERGASLVEYALLLALIAIVAITALTSLSGAVDQKLTDVATTLNTTAPGVAGKPGTN